MNKLDHLLKKGWKVEIFAEKETFCAVLLDQNKQQRLKSDSILFSANAVFFLNDQIPQSFLEISK